MRAWTCGSSRYFGRAVRKLARRWASGLLGYRFGLVLGDGVLQVAELAAREKAQLVELREVLLRLADVADHEIRLADVLVRAAVLRIDAERLVVMLEHEAHVGVRPLAVRVG